MSEKGEERIDKWEIRAEAQERRAEEAMAAQVAMQAAITRAQVLDAEGKRLAIEQNAEVVQRNRRAESRDVESHEAYLANVRENAEALKRQSASWERIAAALEALASKK